MEDGRTSARRRTGPLHGMAGRRTGWLYERLLRCLERATEQVEQQDLGGKAESLAAACEIVLELLDALDLAAGGGPAARQAALYAYLAREISAVGRTLDGERLRRVTGMVTALRDARSGGPPRPPSPAGADRAAVVRRRIEAGSYDSPEVIAELARRLLSSGEV